MAVYKDVEFKQFIETLKNGQIAYWQEIAEALGVEENTITRWKKTPEAIKARQEGIDYALSQMETAGKKDWRMWEAKLKMLGINPANRHEVKVDDNRKNILNKYLGTENATGEAEKT